MAGLSIGFIDMTKNVLDMTTGLQVFTAETGLNTTALQQWQQAAKEVGLGAEVATNSIMRISQLVAGMRTGHGDVGALSAMAALGVRDISGTAYDVMNRIQEAAKGRAPAVAADLLARMGLSPEMMRVFSIPRDERERIHSMITTSDQAQLAAFTKELSIFNQQVLGEFTKVLVDFEPYMKDLTQALVFLVGHLGGWVGKGMGEDAKLFNEMNKHGVVETIGNILNSFADPGMTKGNYKMLSNVTVNVHGVQDPEAVADAIDTHHKRQMTNAHKMFNKQGNP